MGSNVVRSNAVRSNVVGCCRVPSAAVVKFLLHKTHVCRQVIECIATLQPASRLAVWITLGNVKVRFSNEWFDHTCGVQP